METWQARVWDVTRRAVTAHPGQVLAALGVAVTASRIMGVARWNEQTALAILRETDVGTLVVGTVLALLSFGLVIALVAVVGATGSAPLAHPRLVWLLGLPLVLLLATQPLPPMTVVILVAAWAFAPVVRRLMGPGTDRTRADRILRYVAIGVGLLWLVPATLLLVYGMVAGDEPWVPFEVFRLADGTVHAGWVLKTDDKQVVVLDGREVHVVYLKGPITARAICRRRNAPTYRTLLTRAGLGGGPYPVCSTSLV
ncbi:MAG TPA: hypothetical protein VFQ85_05435 [Mycobacteriales bacterium]|jgi:hypothetical protein|nr:hypothetical protein [Mycobacteriales bacterium]